MSSEQWTLIVSVGTFVVACLVLAALIWWRHHLLKIREDVQKAREDVQKIQPPADNTDVLLDAMDGVRDQVDSQGQHNILEHSALTRLLVKIAGRLQFMVAKDISAELGAQQEREKRHAQRKDATEKPVD